MEMAVLLTMTDTFERLLNQFYVDLIEARAEVETSMVLGGRNATRPLERAKEKLAACPATRRVAEVVKRAISALNAERQKEALELIDRALEALSKVEELVKCV